METQKVQVPYCPKCDSIADEIVPTFYSLVDGCSLRWFGCLCKICHKLYFDERQLKEIVDSHGGFTACTSEHNFEGTDIKISWVSERVVFWEFPFYG